LQLRDILDSVVSSTDALDGSRSISAAAVERELLRIEAEIARIVRVVAALQ
jgi:hypothetical protein